MEGQGDSGTDRQIDRQMSAPAAVPKMQAIHSRTHAGWLHLIVFFPGFHDNELAIWSPLLTEEKVLLSKGK